MKLTGWFFVFIWSSGYISSSIGLLYTNPLTFITLRVAIACFIFLLFNLALPQKTTAASDKEIYYAMLVGFFIQFLYPVFFSYSLFAGISPTMLTVILGLQPVLTLSICRDIRSKIQVYGIIGCLIGTAVFSAENFTMGNTDIVNISYAIISLAGITFGTIVQKKKCSRMDIHKNMLVQCFSALSILLPTTAIIGHFQAKFTFEFISSLLWQSILVSSLSSILLIRALKCGAVTNVSTYFSCIPAGTALMAYFILDSAINTSMIIGMIFIFICTSIVQKPELFSTIFNKKRKSL